MKKISVVLCVILCFSVIYFFVCPYGSLDLGNRVGQLSVARVTVRKACSEHDMVSKSTFIVSAHKDFVINIADISVEESRRKIKILVPEPVLGELCEDVDETYEIAALSESVVAADHRKFFKEQKDIALKMMDEKAFSDIPLDQAKINAENLLKGFCTQLRWPQVFNKKVEFIWTK